MLAQLLTDKPDLRTETEPAADLLTVCRTIAHGDGRAIPRAIAGLYRTLRAVYDQGDRAWTAGAPADFLAATLYATPRYYLRLHAHAAGAVDSDLHTHKGIVYSTVLSGVLTNVTATPRFTHDPAAGGLDLWRCACRADGSHTQQRTGMSAIVDPSTVRAYRLAAGHRFVVRPGEYHRLSISRDASTPTVTLCLFEWTDPDAPDAYVVTDRPTPVLADRDMTVEAARRALRFVLDAAMTC